MSIRDAILSQFTRRVASYPIEGLGTIWVQSITELERGQWEEVSIKRPIEADAYLLTLALVDDQGQRIFGAEDMPRIMNLDAAITLAMIRIVRDHVSEIGVNGHLKN